MGGKFNVTLFVYTYVQQIFKIDLLFALSWILPILYYMCTPRKKKYI